MEDHLNIDTFWHHGKGSGGQHFFALENTGKAAASSVVTFCKNKLLVDGIQNKNTLSEAIAAAHSLCCNMGFTDVH